MDYSNDYDYREEMKAANSMGIMITTISCSGMDNTGNTVFQELAGATNGAFEFLTYRQAYLNDEGEEKSYSFIREVRDMLWMINIKMTHPGL